MRNARITEDPRIDPRIKAVFGALDAPAKLGDAESREQLLKEAGTEEAVAQRNMLKAFWDRCDTEEIAPSNGLAVTEHIFVSQPDANKVRIRFIRPDGPDVLPCVYYIHGGGMAILSCYDGNQRAWGRILAAQGVAVAMVDFRNALVPSSADEVAPFPAGFERLRVGRQVGGRQPRRTGHRPRSDRRRRGERRGQPHARNGAMSQAGRRSRHHQRSLCAVPFHRGDLAVASEPVFDREQRHRSGLAQQLLRHGLRDRRTGAP